MINIHATKISKLKNIANRNFSKAHAQTVLFIEVRSLCNFLGSNPHAQGVWTAHPHAQAVWACEHDLPHYKFSHGHLHFTSSSPHGRGSSKTPKFPPTSLPLPHFLSHIQRFHKSITPRSPSGMHLLLHSILLFKLFFGISFAQTHPHCILHCKDMLPSRYSMK